MYIHILHTHTHTAYLAHPHSYSYFSIIFIHYRWRSTGETGLLCWGFWGFMPPFGLLLVSDWEGWSDFATFWMCKPYTTQSVQGFWRRTELRLGSLDIILFWRFSQFTILYTKSQEHHNFSTLGTFCYLSVFCGDPFWPTRIIWRFFLDSQGCELLALETGDQSALATQGHHWEVFLVWCF